VTLAPGATAHAVIRIADVSAFPAATCHPVAARSLRVYPGCVPASHDPVQVPGVLGEGPVFLQIGPVQPRVGIPGHP
jgi:hypothetical protein